MMINTVTALTFLDGRKRFIRLLPILERLQLNNFLEDLSRLGNQSGFFMVSIEEIHPNTFLDSSHCNE